MLSVIVPDEGGQRFCVLSILHHLASRGALQLLPLELLNGRQGSHRWHLIEMIHELECRFLVGIGVLVAVIALGHGDAITMSEAGIKLVHFAECFLRSLDGEKIEHGGGDEYRPWIHEREQSGIINAFRDHAVKILLGVTVRILENAIVNAHGQGSNVAGDRGDFDARFESSDVYRLKAAPARAGDVDAAGINFGEGQQVIKGAQSVPDFPPCQVCAHQVCKIPQHGVLSTDQVVATPAGFCIPELAALSLAYGVPGQHNIPAQHQVLAQRLIMILAVSGVSRRYENARKFCCFACIAIVGHIQKSSHVKSRKAFENYFPDMKAVHRNRTCDPRSQRSPAFGKSANHL